MASGGAIAVTGAVLYVVGRSKASAERARLAPVVARGGVGVSLSGVF